MSRESIRTSAAPPDCVWRVSPSELPVVIATTLSRLSLARASVFADQLRELLRAKSAERLIVLAAVESATDDAAARLAQSLIAIALLPDSGDTATILHVDWCDPSGKHSDLVEDCHGENSRVGEQDLVKRLWQHLEGILSPAGIRFVQWATDPIPKSWDVAPQNTTNTPAAWAPAFEFSRIGTLDYLAQDYDSAANWMSLTPTSTATASLFLEPLDHTDTDQSERFESLIARTYVDSLDCPSLGQFRSACEIISGYRIVAAYAPDLWFTVWKKGLQGVDDRPIGCFLLARHAGPAISDPEKTNPASVVELVYMGIVPEHRGHGFGQQIMGLITEICQQQGATRLILAVDQENHPATAAYTRSGMYPVFRETVWGRSV